MPRLYLLFCLIGLLSTVHANTVTPTIYFTNIDKDNGLSSNYINKIVKDKQGFIWIGTNDGLCRYETFNKIKIYRATSDTLNGLQSNNVYTLYSDSKENLWIGTRLGGLTRFHQPTSTWKTFKHNPQDSNSINDNEILSILEDSKGRIWVGTESGLNLFQPETDNFISFSPNINQPGALQAKAVLSILEDDKGWIWVGTWAGGLHLLLPDKDGDIANSRFHRFLPSDDKGSHNVWAIYQDAQKQYWLGTHGGGLVKMQLPTDATIDSNQQSWKPAFKRYTYQEGNALTLAHNDVKDIYQDDQGIIWVATAGGLNYLEATDTTNTSFHFHNYLFEPDNIHSLLGNVINDLYQDDQGLLWCSTSRGISIYNPATNQFNTHKYSKEIEQAPTFKNIHIDQDGLGWIATPNRGLVNYDLKTKAITIVKNKHGQPLFPSKKANYLGKIEDSMLCIGTKLGISIIDRKQLTIKHYPISTTLEAQGGLNQIKSIIKDSVLGKIWIGTESGLFCLEEASGNYELYSHNPLDSTSISDNPCNLLLEDTRGYLWITTYRGLNRINLKQTKDKVLFERFHSNARDLNHRTTSNRFMTLKEVGNTLYIGTTVGLQSYDYDTKTFSNHSDLDNKFWIESLEKTLDNHLWGSTAESLFYFNTDTKTFNIFEEKDGLGAVNFKLGSSYIDKEGTLYFGSNIAITSLHPSRILQNKTAPTIAITDIKTISPKQEKFIDGIYKKQIDLDYNVYSIAINFAALNFNRPEKNQYAYRLEGFEERWNYTTLTSTATYTNLDPGTYTFHVRAANNDGVWNDTGKRLTIIKHSAFWQTAWFKIGSLLGLFLMIAAGFNLYTRNINNRNRTLKTYNDNLNQEIRERKRVELALKEKETFTRLIMDNIPQHICWIDKEHRFVGGNTTFLNALQVQQEQDLIGQPIEQFYISEDGSKDYEAAINQVIEFGRPIYGKVQKYITNQSKSTRYWLKQDFIPLTNENNTTIGVLTSSTDITEQVKTAEQLRAYNKNLVRSNKELEQFAYIASHDLQSPLTTIINFSGLLEKSLVGKLNGREQEFLRFIISSTKNMQELVNAILEFSKVNNQKQNIKAFNPAQLVAVLQSELDTVLKNKNATIQIADFPEIIQADRIKVKQLLQNLITNGVKFSRKGVDPVITISCIEKDKYWEFQVQDNGIGISEEFTAKIFQLFQRLHAATEYQGTGIGLALCKKLVEQQDGEIWVESTPNEGSSFFFTIKKRAVSVHASNKMSISKEVSIKPILC